MTAAGSAGAATRAPAIIYVPIESEINGLCHMVAGSINLSITYYCRLANIYERKFGQVVQHSEERLERLKEISVTQLQTANENLKNLRNNLFHCGVVACSLWLAYKCTH